MGVLIKAKKCRSVSLNEWCTCFFLCFHRAVRGAVDNGDASRATNGHPSWSFIPGACVWPVCCSHCVHPPGNGGSVCIPSCHPAALVS